MKRCCTYLLVLSAFVPYLLPAQSPRIDSALQHIAVLQCRATNNEYSKGLFPSHRVHLKHKNYQREDNNVFFTGLIVWNLRSQRAKLSKYNQLLADSICRMAVATYPSYRDSGKVTYNFWMKNPSGHFPNDSYFSKRKKYKLPDDLDDTAIIYLSQPPSDSERVVLHRQMIAHANGSKKHILNTFSRYKKIKAYSTWFGKKMPIDFDISVHCNTMCMVLQWQDSLCVQDQETLAFIKKIVRAREHITHPAFVSPHYQKTSIILYHLARLISLAPLQHSLSDIKPLVISDLKEQLHVAEHPMEQLILGSSLQKLGVDTPLYRTQPADFDSFYFFIANMTSTAPKAIKRIFAKSKWTNFYYRSPAYYWSLILENELLHLQTF